MADFNRILIPSYCSAFKYPAGFDSYGLSGKGQFSSTTQVGRTWFEKYPPKKYNNQNLWAFLSYINQLWRNRTLFTIAHYHRQTPFGTISGSPTVDGAGQTGSSITVSAITGTLKHGDIIKFGSGVNIVYDVAADVANGATSIPISPPIFAGGSPANSAAITYTGVKFQCVIDERYQPPECDKDLVYRNLIVPFRESA